jgi:triacylglycerol lipase
VFVHGYLCLAPRVYWLGLRAIGRRLAAAGVPVAAERLPWAGDVEARARRLGEVMGALPQRRLVLVGHSMGGLDARLAAVRHDPRRRVGHVLTVGTPHRGSTAAEWALGEPSLRALLLRTIDRGALRDLTPEGAARVAGLAPDRGDVRYLAIAGALDPAEVARGSGRSGAAGVAEGANDGLVSAASAAWGAVGRTVEADHFGLLGAVTRPIPWDVQARRRGRGRSGHWGGWCGWR